MPFIRVQKFFCIPSLLKVFLQNECWIMSNVSSTSVDRIMWILSFSVLMWWITLSDFQILSQSYISGINPTWLWIVTSLCVPKFNLVIYCWGLFCSESYWSTEFFSWSVLSNLGVCKVFLGLLFSERYYLELVLIPLKRLIRSPNKIIWECRFLFWIF